MSRYQGPLRMRRSVDAPMSPMVIGQCLLGVLICPGRRPFVVATWFSRLPITLLCEQKLRAIRVPSACLPGVALAPSREPSRVRSQPDALDAGSAKNPRWTCFRLVERVGSPLINMDGGASMEAPAFSLH